VGRMKFWLILLYIFSLFLISQTAASAAAETLNVVMDDNYPPYVFRDDHGHLQGILIDQWALWEKRTGIKVNISAMEWDKAQRCMQTGGFDVIDTIFLNAERAKVYDFTPPYATIEVPIFFNKNISGIENTDSLKGFKVGVKKGDNAINVLRQHGVKDLVEFDSYEDIVLAAKKQQIVVFVMDKPPALYYLYKLGIQNDFRASAPVYAGQFHRAVTQGNTAILKEVVSGFSQISDAEYSAIDNRWLGDTLLSPEYINRLLIALSAVCIIVLGLVLWNSSLKKNVLSKTQELTVNIAALQRSERRYRGLLSNLNVGIIVYGPGGNIVLRNQAYLSLLGIADHLSAGAGGIDADISFVHEDGSRVLPDEQPARRVMLEKVPVYDDVLGIARQNKGDILWVQVSAFPEVDCSGNLEQIIVTMVDVTELKRTEQLQAALYRISESSRATNNLDELYRDVHQAIGKLIFAEHFYIAIYDEREGKIEFPYSTDVSHKAKSSRIFGRGLTDCVLQTEQELYVNAQMLNKLINEGDIVTNPAMPLSYWHGVPLKTKDDKTFGVIAVQGYDDKTPYNASDEEVLNFVSSQVAMAIERKRAEEKLIYLSYHDFLTGLYNRAYFEQELQRLESASDLNPHGIIIFDVDGLKLVNDTFGHSQGDSLLIRAADVLQQSLDTDCIVSRIGGDEFAAIVFKATEEKLNFICTKVKDKISADDKGPILLHISMGHGISSEKSLPIDVFRIADNRMYRDKLHRQKGTRGNIIQTLKQMLTERDYITEGHAERLLILAEKLAKSIGMQELDIADLRLFAQFHDIGKVGISDRILNKPGLLTPEERQQMQRHCEIGHRIALSSPDLSPIADWILKHQEWWNGGGYPLGMSGEAIPLECRILAIVDAYDAMTNDRPYRKAMDHEAAVAELKSCSGTQFDPALVIKFCALTMEDQ